MRTDISDSLFWARHDDISCRYSGIYGITNRLTSPFSFFSLIGRFKDDDSALAAVVLWISASARPDFAFEYDAGYESGS